MDSGILSLFEVADGAEAAARLRDSVQADPMALLKAASAISRDGMLPSPAMTRAARDELGAIERATPTTLRTELEATLMGHNVHIALQWLQEIGVMKLVMPELEATVGMAQEAGRKHKDVWEHTKQ